MASLCCFALLLGLFAFFHPIYAQYELCSITFTMVFIEDVENAG